MHTHTEMSTPRLERGFDMFTWISVLWLDIEHRSIIRSIEQYFELSPDQPALAP